MVLRQELSTINPIKVRCDKIEAEIDRDLAYYWSLCKHMEVAYTYEIKCTTAIRLLAIELQKRYRAGGWKVDILSYKDSEGVWYCAILEFKGECE